MITKPMDLLTQHPIRRSYDQKTAFIDDVTAFVQAQHGSAAVEEGKKRVRNIVIGDPETAEFLITAHYDTPATGLFPNLLLPKNHFLFCGYQIGLILFDILAAFAVGYPVFLLTSHKAAAFLAGYAVYMTLAVLPRFGKANRNNMNDNTSGVITLLEIFRTLPESCRPKVCFILFDQEEKGLIGSAAYAKAHEKAIKDQIVLNLDCVGDGDTILLEPMKEVQKNEVLMGQLEKICGQFGAKQIILGHGSFIGSSDHRKFPLGVGIQALHYKIGIGYYCGRIHTNRDTVLDQTNVNLLRAALTALVCQKKEKSQ